MSFIQPVAEEPVPVKRWIVPTAAFVIALVMVSFDQVAAPVVFAIGLALFVGLVVWGYLTLRSSEDEVARAANVVAMSIGAPIGLGIAVISLFVVRLIPSVSEWLVATVGQDATAGFGVGVLFTSFVVGIATLAAWAIWWSARR